MRIDRIFTTLLLLMLLPMAAFAQVGSLRGTILDEQGLAMPGATILLTTQQGKGTIAGADGRYDLHGVKTGRQVVRVTYLGYEPAQFEVEIQEGKTVMVNRRMTPAFTVGQEVVVVGDRLKGQARALSQQKAIDRITNVVSADQVGRFPDANIGDAVKRIPGITMQNDQGEARNIVMRGMAPHLNSVTINGERVPSAEGDVRNVQMDLVPSDMVQTIEVNKALTADMDADAIGGSVNLVTRSAPAGLRISGTGATGYNALSQKAIWTGGLVLGNRFLNNKVGMILSGSYHNHQFGSDNVEAVWSQDKNGNAYVSQLDIRQYEVQRVRQSISAAFDFKIAPEHTIFLNGIYNQRNDWENRFRMRTRKVGAPVFNETTQRYESTADIRRETKGGTEKDARLEDQRVRNLSLSGDHRFFNALKVDWGMTYAKASEYRPNERYMDYEAKKVSMVHDIVDGNYPNLTTASAFDASKYKLRNLSEQQQQVWEEDMNARLNFQLPLINEGEFANNLKFGARYRHKDKKRDLAFNTYESLDDNFGAWGSSVPMFDASKSSFLPGSKYQAGMFVPASFLGGLNLNNPSLFEASDAPEEYRGAEYFANEQVSAGYIMLDQNLGKRWKIIPGLRIERTQVRYTGNQLVTNEDGDLEGSVQQISDEQSYVNVLPSLHARFNATEKTVLRAAWTNTLSRPNYFDLVPYRNVNFADNELSAGNSELKPIRSMNLDLMAEHYFDNVGILSGGVFYKDIKDFIYQTQSLNYNDPLTGNEFAKFTTPLNGEGAQVYGFEVSAQRQLDFLPGFLKNFGLYANYTFTHSETKGLRNADGELRQDLALPGTAKHMYNLSLSYDSKRFVARLSLNHASDYLDVAGSDAFNDSYYDKQTFVDFNASYKVLKNLNLFFEANNLTDQPLRYYQGSSDRTMQMEYYNRRFNLGLKFDLFGSNE